MNYDRYRALIADAGQRFTAETASHTMTVLHDDGLYRHLRFRAADHGFTAWDLITWPGTLTIQGAHGTYTFSRETDMFGFFRSSNGVNVDYWAEKTPGGRDSVKTFAADAMPRLLVETYREFGTYQSELEAAYVRCLAEYEATPARQRFPYNLKGPRQPVKPPTVAELRQQVHDAHEDGELGYEDGVRRLLRDWDAAGVTSDSWEWDLREYDYHFVWSCHAIHWGIGRYNAEKKGEPAAVEQAGSAPAAAAGVKTLVPAGGVL